MAREVSIFLDSGAFSLRGKSTDPKFYESAEFWDYADSYAEFIKRNAGRVVAYANLDVIGDPKLTLRNQRYLENEHGLSPVPVVHFGTNVRWLKKYLECEYDYIGLGGLATQKHHSEVQKWLDACFGVVCDTSGRKPSARLHGFGVTGVQMLRRYPWYSVDSTTWIKYGIVGSVMVPPLRGGEFTFAESPLKVRVSVASKADVGRLGGDHYVNYSKAKKQAVLNWLRVIDLPMGSVDAAGPSSRREYLPPPSVATERISPTSTPCGIRSPPTRGRSELNHWWRPRDDPVLLRLRP